MADKPQEPLLTPKQEAFCLAYMETGNASEAYRRAYQPKTTNQATVNRTAKELIDNHKIAARLQELRQPAIERAQITLEQHLNDLKRLRDLAEASEKYGPAIQAEVARGKASGLYVEKLEHAGQGGGPLTVVVRKFSD
jgi:phage terminase small subunit